MSKAGGEQPAPKVEQPGLKDIVQAKERQMEEAAKGEKLPEARKYLADTADELHREYFDNLTSAVSDLNGSLAKLPIGSAALERGGEKISTELLKMLHGLRDQLAQCEGSGLELVRSTREAVQALTGIAKTAPPPDGISRLFTFGIVRTGVDQWVSSMEAPNESLQKKLSTLTIQCSDLSTEVHFATQDEYSKGLGAAVIAHAEPKMSALEEGTAIAEAANVKPQNTERGTGWNRVLGRDLGIEQ